MNSYITETPDQTKKLASRFSFKLSGGEVVCLYGELGAGKTVFVQGMISYFLPEKRVLSPTFIIVRHYRINHNIIKRFLHIDLYRMKDTREVSDLEFFESMHKPDTIVAVEWAEKLGKLLPKNRIDISLKNLSEQSRSINIDHSHAIA